MKFYNVPFAKSQAHGTRILRQQAFPSGYATRQPFGMWSSEKSVGMVVAACFLVDTDGSRACSFSKLVCDDDSEQEMLQRLRWPGREQPAERSTWKKPAGVRRGRVGVCVPAGERGLFLQYCTL